jgi:sugar/nucleoside kinase (ribokinase family)
MTQKPVVAFGDAAADVLIRLPPKTGRAALRDISPRAFPGGAMGNTAVALARLGVPVALAAAVGGDGYGRFLRRRFEECGVDVAQMVTLPERFTLVTTAIIDREGERYLAAYPPQGMASAYYPAGRLDRDWLGQAAWLHATGAPFGEGTTREAAIEAMQVAREAGVPVSFDLNLRPRSEDLPGDLVERLWQAVRLSDNVFGSGADEFTYFTGESDRVEAAHSLARSGAVVVARTGPEGCLVIQPGQAPVRVPAFPTAVVDTLGAGDVFDAGFITARLAGRDVLEAARWANAAAALSIAGEGAAEHLEREALERLLAGVRL